MNKKISELCIFLQDHRKIFVLDRARSYLIFRKNENKIFLESYNILNVNKRNRNRKTRKHPVLRFRFRCMIPLRPKITRLRRGKKTHRCYTNKRDK